MIPPPEELKSVIEKTLPGVSLSLEGSTLIVHPRDLISVCRWLKESPAYQMDYLANLTAIDYAPAAPSAAAQAASPSAPAAGPASEVTQAVRIETVYHLYSMAKKHGPIAIRCKLPRDNPRIASLVPVYRGAEFQEREVYDLFGVIFEGHPDLRRIFMWDDFKGHPLRKDYVVEDQNVLEEPAH